VDTLKYVKQFLDYFNTFPTFTAKDVKLYLHKKGANKDYYKIFMHNMLKNKRVFSIKKGYYTIHDDPMVMGFAFSPFYYGLETALTYYKLWDYMTPITIITTQKVRSGFRLISGRKINVRRISKRAFFGYSMVIYKDNFYVPMADIEKTLVDLIYFNSNISDSMFQNILKKCNKKKLEAYIKKNYNLRIRHRIYMNIKLRHPKNKSNNSKI
jgi:predicted transcriptional regulator of viral defense system